MLHIWRKGLSLALFDVPSFSCPPTHYVYTLGKYLARAEEKGVIVYLFLPNLHKSTDCVYRELSPVVALSENALLYSVE